MDFLELGDNWPLTVAEIFLCAMVEGPLANPYFDLNSLAAASSACHNERRKEDWTSHGEGGVKRFPIPEVNF